MRLTSRIASDEPAALASRVARHFAHKVPVEDDGAVRRIETRFGLIALEAGETGTEQLSVILGDHRLGEGIGRRPRATKRKISKGIDGEREADVALYQRSERHKREYRLTGAFLGIAPVFLP